MDFRHVKLTYRKRNVELFIDRGVMYGQRELSVVNGNIVNARLLDYCRKHIGLCLIRNEI
jgi:hypothetical protein